MTHSKLPLKLGEYVEFANQTYIENNEESVICTSQPEYAKLIVDSVNKAQRMQEALEDIADIDTVESEHGGECPHQHMRYVVENAKQALKEQ